MTLADDFEDWTDWDYAGFLLGIHLGVLTGNFRTEDKGIVWSSNALGNGLHDVLLALVRAEVLERRSEPDEQFRWRRPDAADR